MEEYYFEAPVSNTKVLCVGPITKSEAEIASEDSPFCDGLGYYLFLAHADDPKKDIEVLAKLVSEEAAARLGAVLKRQA